MGAYSTIHSTQHSINMESIDNIKRLAEQVSTNVAPSSNTNKLVGSLLKRMAAYMAEQAHGPVNGYVFCDSLSQLPTGDLSDKQKRTGYVVGENIYFYVGTGGDTNNGMYRNGGSFRGTPGAAGKSAYEIWKELDPHNTGNEEAFIASLKVSGYASKAVTSRPTGSAIAGNTIYCIAGTQQWTEEVYVDDNWILLATHSGGLSELIDEISANSEMMEDIIDDDYQGTKTVVTQMINYKSVNGEYNGVQISTSGDGVFTLSGTSTSGTTDASLLSNACVLEAGTYKYSLEVLEGTFPDGSSSWAFKCGGSDNQKLSFYFTGASTGSNTLVANSNYRLYFTFASGKVFNVTFRLKVFKEETVAVNGTAKDEKARSDVQSLLPLTSLRAEVDEMRSSYPIVKTYDKNDLYTNNDSTDYYYSLKTATTIASPSQSTGTTRFACISIPVLKGQQLEIYTQGGNPSNTVATAYAITDLGKNVLSRDTSNADRTTNPFEATVTEDGYLFVNVLSTKKDSFKVVVKNSLLDKVTEVENGLQYVKDNISNIKENYPVEKVYTQNILYSNPNNTNCYFWNLKVNNGEIISVGAGGNPISYESAPTSSSQTRHKCAKIEVKKGQHVKVYTKVSTAASVALPYAITNKGYTVLTSWYNNGDSPNTRDYLNSPFEYDVTEDGYLFVNVQTTYVNNFVIEVSELLIPKIEDIAELAKAIKSPKINNIPFNPNKPQLRILHIGTSFGVDSTEYLIGFIKAAGIDMSNTAIYRGMRGWGSFKVWAKQIFIDGTGFYNSTTGEGAYSIRDLFTNNAQDANYIPHLEATITGISTAGQSTADVFRRYICECQWDVIVIQQNDSYNDKYLEWEGHGAGGYLKEYIRILKAYQPNATIAFLMVHSHFSTYPTTVEAGSTQSRWRNIAEGCKFMKENYGVDLIIPVGTAIENIRSSSICTDHYLTRDGEHLGDGLGRYVAAATYYQAILAPRFGKSVLGNSFVRNYTNAELNAASAYTHGSTTYDYSAGLINVTNENKLIAQKAAVLACADMYNVNNPDDYSDGLYDF